MRYLRQLKSKRSNLKEIFEKDLIVYHISEKLFYCLDNDDVVIAKNKMLKKDFDVAGICNCNEIYGFIKLKELEGGKCSNYAKRFKEQNIISSTKPIADIIPQFKNNERFFVKNEENEIDSIITRGDLQKIPVRMFIFGLISLIEMQLTRIIKENLYEEWFDYINPGRFSILNKTYKDLEKKGTNLDKIDCLQFSDKRDIIKKTFVKDLGYSKSKFECLLKKAETIRNNLAHAQPIDQGIDWDTFIKTIKNLEILLDKLEDFKE